MQGSGETVTALPREQTAAREAEELLVFADGYEDAGHPELARRSRVVARELLRTLNALEAERSARRAVQEARDRLQAIIGQKAYQAAAEACP